MKTIIRFHQKLCTTKISQFWNLIIYSWENLNISSTSSTQACLEVDEVLAGMSACGGTFRFVLFEAFDFRS